MRLIPAVVMIFIASYTNLAVSATIYKCKDDKGKLIFQQTACNEKNVMGDSDAHNLWKEMRVLASEGKGILNWLGADLESIKQCNRDIKVYEKKVLKLKNRVSRVELDHKQLAKAYAYLKECAVCKTSAASNCIAAEASLEKAVSNLTEW